MKVVKLSLFSKGIFKNLEILSKAFVFIACLFADSIQYMKIVAETQNTDDTKFVHALFMLDTNNKRRSYRAYGFCMLGF